MVLPNGLVALITGAASGLGKGTLEYFLKKGYQGIVALDLQKFQFDVPNNVLTIQGNVTSEDDVKNVIEQCKNKFGRLDVVVNCAGIGVAFKIYNFQKKEPHSLVEFRKVYETNVVGTFNVNRLALALLSENELKDGLRGCIINTSSISGYEGMTGQVAYSASSGAINSMTLPMARDIGPEGIRCVTIAPGVFHTPLTERLPDIAQRYLAELVPCPPRLGTPEEYAHMVQAVVENPMINGEVIRLDGALRFPA